MKKKFEFKINTDEVQAQGRPMYEGYFDEDNSFNPVNTIGYIFYKDLVYYGISYRLTISVVRDKNNEGKYHCDFSTKITYVNPKIIIDAKLQFDIHHHAITYAMDRNLFSVYN